LCVCARVPFLYEQSVKKRNRSRVHCTCACNQASWRVWFAAGSPRATSARTVSRLTLRYSLPGNTGAPPPRADSYTRARNACAGDSRKGSTKLRHGIKLERTLANPPSTPYAMLSCSTFRIALAHPVLPVGERVTPNPDSLL